MADQTQRLLLQVDAATELLRRHLAEGEQPIERFERRAARMADNVDRSIADMGKRFGTFASLAEDAATRAQRSFEASFSDVQKLAAKAIQAPTVTGGLNVGAADAREAAATAQQQALATRLIADAAERAAQGEGALTEQTRLYVQAARAAAIEAERHAQELTREAGALERVEIELAQAGAGARVFAGSQGRAVTQSGALRAAMQGASYQVQDTFTQLSMGANIFQVVAIQGGQLAGQFANIEGKAGSFARFMIGPWGLAITGALLVLGPLTKGLFEFGDATDDAVAKLKQDAIESDVTARAKARFAGSVEGLTAALKDQDKALRDSAASERTAAERANILARAKRDQALASRQATAAALAEAEVKLGDFSLTGGTTGAAALQNQARSDQVSKLRAERAQADANVKEAERQLNVTRVDLAAEQAAIAIDPIRSVTKLYDDRIRALKAQQREEARLGQQVGAASRARLQQLEAEKKAAVDAAQARQRAANAKPNNNQIGREINVAEATSIIASIGGRVTSGLRSTETQARIYADKLAGRHVGPVAKPGTSDHERGQAIDVAYGPGISIASIRAAFARQGVAIRQLLDEPTQRVYHVAFGKKGPSQASIDAKTERARVALINDDISYAQQERSAQRRLIDAKGKHAATEEDAERLAQAEINAQADAENVRIAGQLSTKKLDAAQAARLTQLNEDTRTAGIRNLILDRANRQIAQRYDAEQEDLQARLSLMRIGQDLAVTDAERRRVGFDILAAEQELRRKALERVRDTSQDPAEVLRAQRGLEALPRLDAAERGQLDQRTASPLDSYRQRLASTATDTNAALQGIAVRGLGAVEDRVASTAAKILGLKGAFGSMVSSAISDLARLATQKLFLSILGGPAAGLAFADGGVVPGYAGGGVIHGPGTGRSDSIIARVSAGEGILTADTVEHYGRGIVSALNSRRLPRFADGGLVSPNIAMPVLRSPRLPDLQRSGRGGSRPFVFDMRGAVVTEALLADVNDRVARGAAVAMLGGSRMAQDDLAEQRMAQIPQ